MGEEPFCKKVLPPQIISKCYYFKMVPSLYIWLYLGLVQFQPGDPLPFIGGLHVEAPVAGRAADIFAAGVVINKDAEGAVALFGGIEKKKYRLGA